MVIDVKAWGETIAKINEVDGIKYFSLSPNNKLNFSPIRLQENGKTYEFSSCNFQRGFAGMISDSMPGVYGREYLDEFFIKHFKTTPSDLEVLQFLGDNTMGALSFEPELKYAKELRSSLILDAKELYCETRKALRGEADFSISEIIAISNSAASGARPKAIVGFNPVTNKMHIGMKSSELPDGFTHAIVKFDNLTYKNALQGVSQEESISQTKGEYIYSLVAKKLGINMAETYLVESEGSAHFVTERFDISKESGTIERLHMHSLSGMMHHNPRETTFGYENLFMLGEKLSIPHVNNVQFFKTMLFNLIFGNTDDHSRNFSFLMDSGGKWRGAPAYDLTFTQNRNHQMMFDYVNGFDVSKKHLIKLGRKYNIIGVAEMIEEMVEMRHTYLKELSIQFELTQWYERINEKTKHVLCV